MKKNVMILAGAGQIGMAIARRMGYGMKIVIGDKNINNSMAIADIMNKAGFDVAAMEMDLSNRESIRSIILRHRNTATLPCLSTQREYLLLRHR